MLDTRIVLVADDLWVRSSITFALEIQGFVVEAFATAEAMLSRGSLNRIDCLVIDRRLPGMDGLELLDRLRTDDLGAPAIVITSNPTRRRQERTHGQDFGVLKGRFCTMPSLG